MPAPEHLLPILDELGDGASVGMAERVAALVERAKAAAVPPDVAEVQGRLDAARADAERMRAEVDSTCALVAAMHAAAVGEVRGPIRGVVEDVADVRTAWLATEARVSDLESLPGVRDAYRAWVDQHGAEHAPSIHDLIEASSLGEPDAVAARASVPIEVGQDLAARAAALPPAEVGDDVDRDGSAPPTGTVEACTTCGGSQDSPPCVPTPDGVGGHTFGGGIEAAADPLEDIDWDDEPDQIGDATRARASAAGPTNAEIRAWCVEHDIPVNAMGAIRADARAAYDAAAHQGA